MPSTPPCVARGAATLPPTPGGRPVDGDTRKAAQYQREESALSRRMRLFSGSWRQRGGPTCGNECNEHNNDVGMSTEGRNIIQGSRGDKGAT